MHFWTPIYVAQLLHWWPLSSRNVMVSDFPDFLCICHVTYCPVGTIPFEFAPLLGSIRSSHLASKRSEPRQFLWPCSGVEACLESLDGRQLSLIAQIFSATVPLTDVTYKQCIPDFRCPGPHM
jgi:hypothetical protein